MQWRPAERVSAARSLGDGSRPIPQGERGTVVRAIGEGERWLVVVEWDSGPGVQWPYQPHELKQNR